VPINIGRQEAAVINNVEGTQVINGGQTGVSGGPGLADARIALGQLEEVVAGLRLAPEVRVQADADLAQSRRELAKKKPDKKKIAEKLTRVVDFVIAAGGVARSTGQVVSALSVLAQWLGPIGGHLQASLPALVSLA
jgi:hypothetical protein